MIKLILKLLVSVVFFSFLQIMLIYQKNRLQFIELQNLQQQRQILIEEWNRLQIEQSTWAQPGRIETIAREQLNMIVPTPPDIMVIKKP
jgi:cell division protein FtsL